MQLCSTAELTDLFAEYYQADVDDPDYLVNVESLNGDRLSSQLIGPFAAR